MLQLTHTPSQTSVEFHERVQCLRSVLALRDVCCCTLDPLGSFDVVAWVLLNKSVSHQLDSRAAGAGEETREDKVRTKESKRYQQAVRVGWGGLGGACALLYCAPS